MPSRYQVKTLFTRIFEEQKEILFLKNYTEHMIGSWSEKGLILKQLKAAFKQAYTTKIEDYQIDQFGLEMTGMFTAEKHKVKFEFTYEYDPSKITLRMVSMKATLRDDYTKTYPITRHPLRDLPASGQAFKELAAVRDLDILNQNNLQRIENSNKLKHKRRSP